MRDILGYMKTTISIPDNIFETAELLAFSLGISRNELFTRAIVDFIEVEKYKGVTSQLNRIYSKSNNIPDQNLAAIQHESISPDVW